MRFHTIEDGPDLTILSLSGSLDSTGVEQIKPDLLNEIEYAGGDVIIDLSEVDFIASLGMTLLVKCTQMQAAEQNQLVLCDAQPLVDEALRYSKITHLLTLVETLDDARDYIRTP
jgi:anti-anti-sigma factor